MATISTGIHWVKRRLANGEHRHYAYAYRGGPQVASRIGRRPAVTPELLAAVYEARKHQGSPDAFDNVIDAYRESKAFTSLKPSTQRDYRQWLTRISQRFGKVPIRFFNGDEMRGEIVAWHDEMADTPRMADMGVGVLARLLAWSLDRFPIKQNAAKGIKKLYKSNRADLIWEPRHWEAVNGLPPEMMRVLTLAKLTGISQGDLFRLTWDNVGKDAIDYVRGKTDQAGVVPIYPELRRALGKRGKGFVCVNASGTQWTTSGWNSAWRRHGPANFDRHFHDIRGTFATVLCELDFPDSRIAMIMGWKPEKVAAIRERYVNRARVMRSLARKMGEQK